MWALALRFWRPLACVAVLLLAWLALHHWGVTRFSAGYQQAVSENAKALADWKIKYDAQVKADEARIANAHRGYELELAQLAAVRSKPLPRLMCHSASSSSRDVPTAAGVHRPEVADAGVLDGTAAPDFDPTSALADYAADVEYLTVNCRHLNMEVHGHPSAVNSPPQ